MYANFIISKSVCFYRIPLVFLFTSLILLSTENARSSEEAHPHETGPHVHGSHSECPIPKTATDILKCVQIKHPFARRAQLSSEHLAGLQEVAEQIPNPEVDLQSGFNSDSRGRQSNIQLGLMQPIEWGGKRGSRIKQAKAQWSQSEADLQEVQAEIIVETVIKLHRLRQLDIEKALLQEAAATLSKLVSQRVKLSLTPEQRVSLSLYRLAQADAKIREAQLFEEEKSLEHFFHVSTGHSLEEIRPVLPTPPAAWPVLSGEATTNGDSPSVLRSKRDRDLAFADLEAARAYSWPSLKLGPMVILERSGPQSENLLGVNLNMELPIFNMNGAGRKYASMGLEKAERLIELTKSGESHERAEQFKVYQRAVDVLKETPTVPDIERTHRANHSMALKGLIPGALLLESNRQRADLIKGRHDRELKALEALWLVYKFDGRIFEESL